MDGGSAFGICTVATSCKAGSTGGLGGEMRAPGGVATDTAGDVYVADTNNHRVERFDSSGSFVSAWGKGVNGGSAFGVCAVAANCQAGAGGGLGGEMYFPFGVATDAAGDVYVADASNNRVQKFDSSGNFVRAWGKGVNGGSAFGICTVAANCRAGTSGGLGGEMNYPDGVATDAAGNVYVTEEDSNRVQKFDSSGNFVRAWGKGVNGGSAFGICTVAANCQAGTTGGLGGEMNNPEGVATDAAGNVYVADTFNNRVQKFDSSGNFVSAWGEGVNGGASFGVCTVATNCQAGGSDSLGGEMNNPDGVATDAAGDVYVADESNNRVQKFDSSGNFVSAWGEEVNGGTAFGVCTVAANCQAGSGGGLGGEMSNPEGLATDAAGDVYVADQSNNRVQKFTGPHSLTVSLAGTGTGTVTGASIHCPGTCSGSYPYATTVTLTATDRPGSTFTGWAGGGCSGTGACTVTMRSDQRVTATFTLVPTLSGLKVSPHKFSLAGRKVSGKCVKPTGKNSGDPPCRRPLKLKISYTLSDAATVTFTLTRKTMGRKVNGKCVKPTGKNKKPCKRMVTVPGELVKSGTKGDNSFTFNGKIGGHKLAPGSYQLTATPTTGKPSQISFKIVP